MKHFTSKTVDDAIQAASKAVGIPAEQLIYKVIEEKKGLFGIGREATIEIYDIEDAALFAEEYLKTALGSMGVEVETSSRIDEEIIHLSIDSERNPILIGKNGRTLQALNELTRLAVSNKFRHRYRILLDVGGYKEDKYGRLQWVAKKTAREVMKTKIDVKLDPMTADERRIIHNTLSGMNHIKTESSGEGRERAVTIKYVD